MTKPDGTTGRFRAASCAFPLETQVVRRLLCKAMHRDFPVAAPTANPHYERLGGHDAVVRLVDAFYAAMDRRADAKVIRAMHAPDLAHVKAILVMYLAEWMGGPRAYQAERGAPMLRRRHQPFDIDDAARDAWMACMREALQATCPDEVLRAQLDAAFLKVALQLRNTESPSDAPPGHRPSPTTKVPS